MIYKKIFFVSFIKYTQKPPTTFTHFSPFLHALQQISNTTACTHEMKDLKQINLLQKFASLTGH